MILTEYSIRIHPKNSNLGFIRIERLVRIHSDSKSRIETDGFLTELHQTRLKSFFGLTRIGVETDLGIILIDSEWILIRNFYQSNLNQIVRLILKPVLLFPSPARFTSSYNTVSRLFSGVLYRPNDGCSPWYLHISISLRIKKRAFQGQSFTMSFRAEDDRSRWTDQL